MTPPASAGSTDWAHYVERYRRGEWRSPLFAEMVLDSLAAAAPPRVVLDIGAGQGFDGDPELRAIIAGQADRYVAVDPDPAAVLAPCMSELHRCPFDEAPIAPCSVSVAFASFVLEHVAEPRRFFARVHDVLVPGGEFWGFTVDVRHYFSFASHLLERLALKDGYLDRVRGRRVEGRYENFPTFYRANSPRRLARYTAGFARAGFCSMHRVGQVRNYFPYRLRPLADRIDRLTIALGLPGSLLLVRLTK